MDLKNLTLDYLLESLPEELLEELGERVPQKKKDYVILKIGDYYCIRWAQYKGVRNDLELAERILNDSQLGKPNKSGLFHILFDIFLEERYQFEVTTDPILEEVTKARKDSMVFDEFGNKIYAWFRTYEIAPKAMKKIYAKNPKKVLGDIMKIPLWYEDSYGVRIKTVDELEFEQRHRGFSVTDPKNTTVSLAEEYYDID